MASHLSEAGGYEGLVVVGVSVTSDATSSVNNSDVTGVVKIKPQALSISQLRDLMRRELPSLPPFQFLTKQGWPITDAQEPEIKVSDLLNEKSLLTIRRCFSQPRVGVRNLANEIYGFIFIDYNKNAADLRQALKEQLVHLVPDFQFLDRNHWPVCTYQEKDMLLWDLVSNSFVTLRSSIPDNVSWHTNSIIDSPDGQHTLKKFKGSDTSSLVAIEGRSIPEKDDTDKSVVLISYVRAEAAKHARNLKGQLIDRGFKVYLDVDEIHGGSDWQDALNLAVQQCHLFIPLITPQYGQTIWTNREVKLADQMKKTIIPINFLNYWPPERLAIQFTSLHFVPWKSQSELDEEKMDEQLRDRSDDIRFWDTVHIKRVVENISNCIHENEYKIQEDFEDEFFKKDKPSQSIPMSPIAHIEFDSKPIELKPLVVLSVHPNDKEYTNNISSVLRDIGYDVWSSSDMLDEFESHSQPYSMSRLASPMTPSTPSFPDLRFTENGPLPINNSSQESTCSDFHYPNPSKRPSLQFTYSLDSGPRYNNIFNRSDSQVTLSPVAMDKLRIFRSRAKQAAVVIALLSEDYCKAKTSHKQAYYCEHRKRVIPIKLSNSRLPPFMTCLFGHEILEYRDSPEFFEDLRQKVKNTITDPHRSCITEVRLQSKVQVINENIKQNFCIYVTGSTRLQNARTESICIAIGEELGACNFLSLATNGFHGVGEIVGRSFCEVRDLSRQRPAELFNILPHHDATKDLSKVSSQLSDGKFQKLPYGQTLFVGESVCERDSVVARCFGICLLIEGGPDAAQEVEQFVWNDNIVIPVISTGGAAAGEHSAPKSMMEVPPGVSEGDWMLLRKRDEPVEVIASAIKRILCSLKTKEGTIAENGKPRRKRSTKKAPKLINHPSHSQV